MYGVLNRVAPAGFKIVLKQKEIFELPTVLTYAACGGRLTRRRRDRIRGLPECMSLRSSLVSSILSFHLCTSSDVRCAARYTRRNRRRRFWGAGNTHRLTMVLLSFISITPVDAVQIRVPGGVQQCHAAALAFLQGTPPYDINIVQDSGDPLLQVRQTQNTLLWLANAAAGTRVDVEVSDDDGGVADLSLVVDSSDDDSCLDSSGDSISSTTPSTSPGPSPSSTSTPATSSTFVTTSTTFDATSSRLSVTAQSSARTSSGPTSEGSSSSSLLLSTSYSERTTPSTTSAIASSIGVTLLPPSSASAQLARKSGLGTAAVAGISVVSAAVALSILGVLYWRCMRYRAQPRRRNNSTAEHLGGACFPRLVAPLID